VLESWLTFPIGTLKTAGAAGLLLGLIGVPLIVTAARQTVSTDSRPRLNVPEQSSGRVSY
jgi:hypothetical protein